MYEVGRSSSIPEYTPTRPSLDEASFRLAKHLAQNISDSPSQGKGISFEEEHSGDDKTLVSKLREEIEILRQEVIEKNILLEQHDSYITKLRERDELKSKQISDLQTDLGSLTAFYFGLKCKLFEAFGDKFQSIFQKPHGIEDPPRAPTQSSEDDLPLNQPPPRTTTIFDRFDKESDNARSQIMIKHGKRTVITNKSEGLLFMKNSNENRKAKDPVLTVTNLKKRKFGDKYGDRSGIKMWAFDHELNLWVVKRNSGIPEYY